MSAKELNILLSIRQDNIIKIIICLVGYLIFAAVKTEKLLVSVLL